MIAMMRWGRWWAIQAAGSIGPVNLGIHGELRVRSTNAGTRYGPYLDVHLPFCVVSVGRNPIYAGEIDLLQSYSRGGLRADDDSGG
jgi:hypothetical protein